MEPNKQFTYTKSQNKYITLDQLDGIGEVLFTGGSSKVAMIIAAIKLTLIAVYLYVRARLINDHMEYQKQVYEQQQNQNNQNQIDQDDLDGRVRT